MLKKQLSIPVGIAAGLLAGIIISVGGAVILAAITSSGKMTEESMPILAVIIQIIAAMGSAWLASALTKQKRLMVCLCSGGAYLLLTLGCTALFFGGQYEGLLGGILSVAGGSLLVAFLGLKGKKTPHHKKAKRAYR